MVGKKICLGDGNCGWNSFTEFSEARAFQIQSCSAILQSFFLLLLPCCTEKVHRLEPGAAAQLVFCECRDASSNRTKYIVSLTPSQASKELSYRI